MKQRPLVLMAILIGLTGLMGSFASYRFRVAGEWLPTMPATIGSWEIIDTPLSTEVLALLGNPKGQGRECRSRFSDVVSINVITAGPFENYHDPTVCVGGTGVWDFTAKRTLRVDGLNSSEVRAMIFRQVRNPKVRLLMYYWTQTRDGHTSSEPMMGNYRDISARFKTGFGAVALGRQNTIIRVYTMYHENDDTDGLYAQRGVHEVSQAVYRHLLQEGKSR
jgi:hypothetical protein